MQRGRARKPSGPKLVTFGSTPERDGEGSGIFAAQPLTYTAADMGRVPIRQPARRNVVTDGRHYIDVNAHQASAWNDAPDLDAAPLASDARSTMNVGERRWITVVMQNTGDGTWTAAGPLSRAQRASRADGFTSSSRSRQRATRSSLVFEALPAAFRAFSLLF